MKQDKLIKEVERTIEWMSDVARFTRSDLKVGLASSVQRLSIALGKEMDKDVEKLLYRPIDRDKARVIKSCIKNEMHTPPNAWQKKGGK